MCWLWDLTWWPLSAVALVLSLLIPVIAVEVPRCLCLLHYIFSPFQQIFNSTGALLTCLYCAWLYSWDQNSEGSSTDWSKSHVCAVAPSTVGAIGPRIQPTAWLHNHQACGARLSEREQMVTWIVQQVLSTPAHFFACSTLPQQTPLIIDVLEWPHRHWILPSGRIINFITATLTYLLYYSARNGTSRGVDSLQLLNTGIQYTYWIYLSVCMYAVFCSTGVGDKGHTFLTWPCLYTNCSYRNWIGLEFISYLIRDTFL